MFLYCARDFIIFSERASTSACKCASKISFVSRRIALAIVGNAEYTTWSFEPGTN